MRETFAVGDQIWIRTDRPVKLGDWINAYREPFTVTSVALIEDET